MGTNKVTEADEDPLEGLVRAGLQVEQGQLAVGAVLRLPTDRLEQHGGPVQLKRTQTHTG